MKFDWKDMERGNISQSVGGRIIMPYLQKKRSNDVRKLSWYFLLNRHIKYSQLYYFKDYSPLWLQELEIISVGLGLENLLQTISIQTITGKDETIWS
jgi:hypothetical protein